MHIRNLPDFHAFEPSFLYDLVDDDASPNAAEWAPLEVVAHRYNRISLNNVPVNLNGTEQYPNAIADDAMSDEADVAAIWHAAWCLQTYFGERRRNFPRAWAGYLATLPSTCAERFIAIYGYDPAELRGWDSILFDVHVQVWWERRAMTTLGVAPSQDQNLAFVEFYRRWKTIYPDTDEWEAMMLRMFPLTIGSSTNGRRPQRQDGMGPDVRESARSSSRLVEARSRW